MEAETANVASSQPMELEDTAPPLLRLIDYERKRQEQATKQRQDEIASFAMGLLQMVQDGDCPDGIFFGLYKDGVCHHGLLGNLRDDLVIGRGAVSGLLRVINDILNERRRQG